MMNPLAVLLVLLLTVNALPLVPRVVYSPPITVPNADTVWTSGSIETVIWDITDLPPDSELTTPFGRVVLGYLANDSENLMLDDPLAEHFKLSDGQVNITVPSVTSRSDYIIVLFGDSGNASPEFSIHGVAVASSSGESGESPTLTSLSATFSSITAQFPSEITSSTIPASSASSSSLLPSTSSVQPISTTPSITATSESTSTTAEAVNESNDNSAAINSGHVSILLSTLVVVFMLIGL